MSKSPPQWRRRDVLEGGLLAAGSLVSPGSLLAADGEPSTAAGFRLPPIIKRIPSTGETLAPVGIGTNAFYLAKYEELNSVLQWMYEMGGTMIDTSGDYPNPGAEESELVVGRALAELHLGAKMFVSTKINAEDHQMPGSPRDTLFGEAAFNRSLQRLQTQKVNLLYVHHVPSIDPLMPLLQELKQSGKTRYIGISMLLPKDQAEFAEKMRQYPVDFVQVPYSLGSREVAASILPLALERRIAACIDVPLRDLRKVSNRPLPRWAADIDAGSWAQFMLKYVISHPAVTCAVPGSTTVDHLIDNQLAARGRLPDAAVRRKMEQLWDSMA
jgi:aryl-alcohol dehydrogenase-like predicted oxidoreductase